MLLDFEHKKVAIWGLGKEGLESYRLFRAAFPTKPLVLINQTQDFTDKYSRFLLEDEVKDHLQDIDVVIKSPGISLYHPLCDIFRHHEIIVTSATNIWFAQKRGGTVIAITGSNGKSTTCALLTHILSALGMTVEMGGNIGTPLFSLGTNADYYVVELSSYQTADLDHEPDIAVLLNLFPEHIQWHKSHEQYFADKIHLIRTGAPINILNRTDPLTRDIVTPVPKGTLWFNDPAAVHIKGDSILCANIIVGQVTDATLPGRHNLENICAALTVCRELGLNLKTCFTLAATYAGLVHRLENVGTIGGIRYINDSISTTPEATIAALKTFKGNPITLIAGGEDREQDYTQLARYITAHPDIKVITAYSTGPRIAKALGDKASLSARNLKDAIEQAQKITPKGGIILLSPAAPSYDAFKNFEMRGDNFKNLIKKHL